jgi:hypothetical protein
LPIQIGSRAGFVQTGADGARSRAEPVGHRRLREVAEVEEHDGIALAGRERGDRRRQLVRALAGENPFERLLALIGGALRERAGLHPPLAQRAQAEHAADAGEPRAEALRLAQPVQLQPRDKRGILRDIRARVAEYGRARSRKPRPVACEQLGERLRVTGSCSSYQDSIAH